ncbi:Uncharacterised protein [Escherichia coli]|nr:Uncharacterised protein [Escherichia coli]
MALLRNQPKPTTVGHKAISETTSNLQNYSLLPPPLKNNKKAAES